MGLLDSLYGTPDKAQAMGLLGASMMAGNTPQGLLSATQFLGGADERELKRKYTGMQMQSMESEIEARRLKALQAERQAEFDRNFMGGGGAPAAPGVGAPAMPGPGGMSAPAGAPAGGGGFTAQQIAQQYGIPLEAVVADYRFNGGKKIGELIASRSAPKWENVNGNLVNTNAPGFQGGFQPGMAAGRDGQVTAWQPDGQGSVVVGAPRGALDTYRAYQGVSEQAKADFDPVQVVGPDGAARYVPRTQVVGGGQPQPQPRPQMGGQPRSPMASMPGEADRFAILSQELQRAQQSGNAQDVAALQAEIARLPASARVATNPSGLAVPGFQATPTSAQAAEAAAAKVKAEADARAESDRQAGRVKKSDSSTEMLTQIQRARNLLSFGPTNSSTGAVVDKVLGSVGVSTPGANYAAALDTISGWLTSNTPRMEGPQSNIDQENYKIMAGRVGDRTMPVEQRLAALDEVERIQGRYANVTPSNTPASGGRPPQPMKGMIRNGYRFKGGDPASQSSWEKL